MIMDTEQLNRFNILSQKVINESASFNELSELKALLSTLNNLVGTDLPKAIVNFNEYARSADISL